MFILEFVLEMIEGQICDRCPPFAFLVATFVNFVHLSAFVSSLTFANPLKSFVSSKAHL